MPDILDIIGFVFSIISLLGLHHYLKEIFASRLPQRRLQAVKAELAEIRELLEHLKRVGYPVDAVQGPQSRLDELDVHAVNLGMDVSKWKAKGFVRRYLHSTERVALSRACSALRRDTMHLLAHLHELPPLHPTDRADDVQTTSPATSSCTSVSIAAPIIMPITTSPEIAPSPLPVTTVVGSAEPASAHDDARVGGDSSPYQDGRGRTSALEALPTDDSFSGPRRRVRKKYLSLGGLGLDVDPEDLLLLENQEPLDWK